MEPEGSLPYSQQPYTEILYNEGEKITFSLEQDMKAQRENKI
jgi:hypothetical protein